MRSMKEEVSFLVGSGGVHGQRSVRLAALYSVIDLRGTGLSWVERRTFHVDMMWNGGKGRATVDDMSLYTTLVPVCCVGGHSRRADDSLTHVLTCVRDLG